MASYNITLTTITLTGTNGPCYCHPLDYATPVITGFQPGDVVNLGQLTTYTFEAFFTPDAGPNQPFDYVTSGVEVNFSGVPLTTYPRAVTFSNCAQTDTACQAQAIAGSLTTDLVYTLPGNSIQLAWMGNYSYVGSVEAPLPGALPLFFGAILLLGLWFGKRK